VRGDGFATFRCSVEMRQCVGLLGTPGDAETPLFIDQTSPERADVGRDKSSGFNAFSASYATQADRAAQENSQGDPWHLSSRESFP